MTSGVQWGSGVQILLVLLAALACQSIAATAYDGDEAVAEGWTFRVCGLGKLGISNVPAYACAQPTCPISHHYQENDLVFVHEDLASLKQAGLYCVTPGGCPQLRGTDVRLKVTRVADFTVFLKLEQHKAPFGYVGSSHLCDNAKPK